MSYQWSQSPEPPSGFGTGGVGGAILFSALSVFAWVSTVLQCIPITRTLTSRDVTTSPHILYWMYILLLAGRLCTLQLAKIPAGFRGSFQWREPAGVPGRWVKTQWCRTACLQWFICLLICGELSKDSLLLHRYISLTLSLIVICNGRGECAIVANPAVLSTCRNVISAANC